MSAYSQLILADAPALHWTLDADTGATDLSGNGYDGTAVSGISIGGYSGSPITGESTSTDFAGGYITSSYNPFTAGTVRTYSGWASLDVTTATGHILVGSVGANWQALQVVASNRATTWYTNGGANGAFGTFWPSGTGWHHWAMIFSDTADTAALYINGALVNTVAAAATYGASPGLLAFGAFTGTQLWDGRMAHVAIFERALTASEIQGHYRAGIAAAATTTRLHEAGRAT